MVKGCVKVFTCNGRSETASERVQDARDDSHLLTFGRVAVDEKGKIDHEYDIFYYSGAGLAWRFVAGKWVPITDQQTLAALEKAKKAQDTADAKRRNFVDVPVPPYDEGDTWSNAYYGTLYTNDNLVCVNPKAEGEDFSIDDWQPTSDMNSAAKKVFESLIEQLDDRITLQVTAHDTLSTAVTALGVRMDGAEEQLTIYANKTNTLEGTVTQLGIDLDAAEEQSALHAPLTRLVRSLCA